MIFGIQRLRHLELLVSLVLVLLVPSFFTDETMAHRAVYNCLFLAVVCAAVRTLSNSRTYLWLTMLFGTSAFLGSWAAEFVISTKLTLIVYGLYLGVFAILLLALCESVFEDDEVSADRIIGAVSIYIVLGLVWSFAYAGLEAVRPHSFDVPTFDRDLGIEQSMLGEMLYFSGVTLTTLGYGDIAPISKPARMLSMLEAIVGQLYLAIIIARMVGLHIAKAKSQKL